MLQTTLHEQPCQADLSLEYALSVPCESLGPFHARQIWRLQNALDTRLVFTKKLRPTCLARSNFDFFNLTLSKI